ncbi:MAG: hypothetical protein P8Y70_20225 [Candidatus Lokiarchaeota archaeon]
MFCVFFLEFLFIYFINVRAIQIYSGVSLFGIISLLFTLFIGGYIVDHFINRMYLLILSAGGTILSFLLILITHETNILNRGRLLGYFFFLALTISHILIVFTQGNLQVALLIGAILFGCILIINIRYSYKETEERMRSEKTFKKIILEHPIKGYFIVFMTLGFILGNAFPVEIEIFIEPISFYLLLLSFLLITGILLDNMGRKRTFVAGILLIAALIIFSGIFKQLYYAVFLGLALPIIFITLFTLTGDFSTERNTLKYRGRITSVFSFSGIAGFLVGTVSKFIFTQIYFINPELWWIPELINGLNSLLLIFILVWMMPLPELLSSKESDWAETIKNLYVFNRNSVCLFTNDFKSNISRENLPSEDLVTGGLSGILSLVTEITNEKKMQQTYSRKRQIY